MTDIIPENAPEVNLAACPEAVRAFLLAFNPEGPWHIAAIRPEGGKPACVLLTNIEDAVDKIVKANATHNTYFHVNPTFQPQKDRSSRETVARVNWLYVDIDPPKKPGTDLAAEREKIKGKLTTGLAKLGIPIPTFVIDSGGGFQAFWKLETPIELDGTEATADEAALYSKRLGRELLGGDGTHNVDRIMRIPGTVNWPDSKKRAGGRVPALAKVVQNNLDAGAVYPIERFEKATGEARTNIKVDHFDPQPFDAGKYKLPDHVHQAIQATEEELTDKWKSRSERTWFITKQFQKANVPPGEVVGFFIDNPELPICRHIWFDKNDRKRNANMALSFARSEVTKGYSQPVEGGAQRVVFVAKVDVARTVDETATEMIECAVPVYKTSHGLIRLVRGDDVNLDQYLERDPEALLMKLCQPDELKYLAAKYGVAFADSRKEDGSWKFCAPPGWIFQMLISTLDQHDFRFLHAIAHTPTLTRNEPGYDADQKVLLSYSADRFKDLPLRPSDEQARAAIAFLKEPVAHYIWADDFSPSVYLAAVLAAVIRATMTTCPMFAFNAYDKGAGKTRLAQCVAIIGSGYRAPIKSWIADQTENEKALKSSLRSGDHSVILDNTKVPIGGDILEAILTEPTYKFRDFGKLGDVTTSTRVLFMATGNNLTFAGDMGRRALTATVVPKGARPELEKFPFNPVVKVMQERDQHVAAALTVLRWYRSQGGTDLTPFQSFEDFDLIRGALVALGEPDPVKGLEATRSNAGDDEGLYYLLDAIEEQFPAVRFTSDDVLAELVMAGNGSMVFGAVARRVENLLGKNKDLSSRRVTWILKQHSNKPLNGKVLRSSVHEKGFVQFWLEAC